MFHQAHPLVTRPALLVVVAGEGGRVGGRGGEEERSDCVCDQREGGKEREREGRREGRRGGKHTQLDT